MTLLIPMLGALAFLVAPTDTVFVLGTVERDLRGSAPRHVRLIPQVIDGDRAEGTPSDIGRAVAIWDEIQRSNVTIFQYSPGGDRVRAIPWSERDQRLYQLGECC